MSDPALAWVLRELQESPAVADGDRGRAKEPDADEPVGESWRPVNLVPFVTGDSVHTPPTMLVRTDGEPLLYSGKVHAFNAEPETAKTWLALLGCAQQMEASEHVLFIDLEDTAATAIERLRALGVADETIVERFHYVTPDEPIGLEVRAVIVETLEAFPVTLCVIDGVTEALALCGLKSTDNDDVARFLRRLPKLVARRGIAVVMLDHVTKDRDTRGTWALGAQHKKAGIDVSVALEVVPGTPFGRGREGKARVTITKDKHGFLRGVAIGGKAWGTFVLISSDDDGASVVAELRPPEEAATWRPTVLMERLSRALELQHEALSLRETTDLVQGKAEAKRIAVACLVSEGYVSTEQRGQARLHRSVRAFRDYDDGERGT